MKRSIRSIARAARESEAWPSAVVLVAVLLPAVCLLWFMAAAMRNERDAARQRLVEAYRLQLSASQTVLEGRWAELNAQLESIVKMNSAPAAFAKAVRSGMADSLVIFDDEGRITYPNSPSTIAGTAPNDSAWGEAGHLEYARRDFKAAASRYCALATQTTNVDLAARALQAAARCFAQAGEKRAAIELITGALDSDRYRDATDPQGRLIIANAELLALELAGDPASQLFESTGRRLAQRLNDYDDAVLAAPQRRFLMKQLQKLSGGKIVFETLIAEELAAEFAQRYDGRIADDSLRRASLAKLWEFAIGGRALALVNTDRLSGHLQTAATPLAKIALLPPGVTDEITFVSAPAGKALPGWTLALSLNDSAAKNPTRTSLYLWTGILVVVTMGVLSMVATRAVRRRMALARLRNDLAATVSHELKTPLASMRVLIDTLLDSDRLNESTTREYLQLIAAENQRLSRLIQNFLTFARLEQNKHVLNVAACAPSPIIEVAAEAVRERFNAPGCRFEVQTAPDLPNIVADSDALATALVNLLDNAWKYSGDIKHIVLCARAEDGYVAFVVQDNGIGIPPRETKRIFDSFYQVDRRLSRNGSGCGLGLSIVQSIVSAHAGRVSVTSEPGRGSTFTIAIPTSATRVHVGKEAIA